VRQGIEGRLVPANDAASLAEALVALSRRPEEVARMGEAARARVLDGFTERQVIERVKQLYRSILAS
jgi:glycosyltransferase involved in cell wall biosynthesis